MGRREGKRSKPKSSKPLNKHIAHNVGSENEQKSLSATNHVQPKTNLNQSTNPSLAQPVDLSTTTTKSDNQSTNQSKSKSIIDSTTSAIPTKSPNLSISQYNSQSTTVAKSPNQSKNQSKYQPINQPTAVAKSPNQSINRPVSQLGLTSISKSRDQSINKPVSQSTAVAKSPNQSINQPVSQLGLTSTAKSPNQSINQPVSQLGLTSTKKSPNQSINKPVSQSTAVTKSPNQSINQNISQLGLTTSTTKSSNQSINQSVSQLGHTSKTKSSNKKLSCEESRSIARALLSTKEMDEREMYLEKLIQSLQDQRGEEGKGEYISRVINSISDILKLEESLDFLDGQEHPGPKPIPPPTATEEGVRDKRGREELVKWVKKVEEEEQLCAFCKALCSTRCTGCRLVYYCDRKCQREDWRTHKDVCRPYTIARRRDSTRVLVASRDLQADDLILNEAPLVLGPRPGSAALCLACYRRLSGCYRCSKCNFPLCSKECEGGLEHSLECKVFERCKALQLQLSEEDPRKYQDAVLSLRCLISKRQDPERWKAVLDRFDSKVLEMIGSSESNREQEIALKHRFQLNSIPDFGDISDLEIRKVLGLLQLHNIPTKLPYAEVQGIYANASSLAHSCVPNAKLVWDSNNGRLIITATESIAKGTPITTIFTDILWGTRARRDHLQQSRRISCTCPRCQDPTELGTYFSATICRKCPTRTAVLPIDPLSSSSPWECCNCGHQVNSKESIHETLVLGAAVSEALQQTPTIKSLEKLQEEWTKRFHSNHYHLHALKHSLFQLYGRRQEKSAKKDSVHWEEIAKKERACKEFLRVCSLLDPSLANTTLYVGLTFYEYHKTILQNAKMNYGLTRITTFQLRKRMLLAKELLRKAMNIFKEEPEDSPEGQLYLNCQEEIISIGKWMLAVGLCQ